MLIVVEESGRLALSFLVDPCVVDDTTRCELRSTVCAPAQGTEHSRWKV
jgi:hypothetical protein